jgi:hypothetical protein
MFNYRCYFLNDENRIVGVESGECRNDQGAVDWAFLMFRDRPRFPKFEIWDQSRMVFRASRRRDSTVIGSAPAQNSLVRSLP